MKVIEYFFETISVPDFLRDVFEKDDWYLAIGRLKEYLSEHITSQTGLYENEKLSISGTVSIGKNCVIGAFVVIDGPVYIGDDVEIGPGTFIRPGSVIGNGCVVGHAAEVKNAVMMDGAKISNHVFCGDSILGVKARMGGHCESTNRRFDQGEVEFSFKNKKLKTGLDKLGMVLGEESRLGGDVLTAPGTMIGKKTFVETGLSVSGYIPPNSYVKNDARFSIKENEFSGTLHQKSTLYEKK